jgi:hypothetical protein
LQPEARAVALATARAYLRHTRPHFVGLIAHGSAVKGGAIPGCSDLDLQLYLDPAAFDAEGNLPVDMSLALARDLAAIDPSPYSYIQCYAWPCALPDGYVGPIPGAYAVLAGRLPIPEATAVALRASARRLLAKPDPLPSDLLPSLLTSSPAHIQRRARLSCTDVWPALYAVLALRHDDPIRVWKLPKQEAMALLPPNSALAAAYHPFYAAVRDYYPAQDSPARGLDIIAAGVTCLRAVKDAWRAWRENVGEEQGSR